MTIDEIRELGKKEIDFDRHETLFGLEKANTVLHFWMEGYRKGIENPDRPLRLFEKLDALNQLDTENKTALVRVSGNFNEGHTVKGGALVSMGVDAQSLLDLISKKHRAILCIVDGAEYDKLK